jgi:Ca-activated chloride channel family protein
MSFLWPKFLFLLLVVPVLAGLYFLLLNRKKKFALRYSSLADVKAAMGASQRIRRHLPPLFLLLALTLLIAATARPTLRMTLPFRHQTIVLAIDVSKSMQAIDVAPDRLTAAQDAARSFVMAQPRNTRIGIVSYGGTATVAQAPTANREDVIAAIERLQLQGRTAVGSGLLVSLKILFPDLEIDLDSLHPRRRSSAARQGNSLDAKPKADSPAFIPVAAGSYMHGAIILLTDGQNTTGPDPVEAAKMAAERGVRVYTLGLGTPNGEVVSFGGSTIHVRLDEESLKEIARLTKAEYFYADNGLDLKKIYQNLNLRLGFEKKETEITAFFTAAAAFLSVLSGLLSMLWFNRMV